MISALALTGPTASGKTALSIELAKAISAEIICLDSMQIYKDMNIGTAKPTCEERSEVAHHVVDFLPFNENYSAERYKEDALLAANGIISRGKIPLFVGGTGLYIDTLSSRGVNLAPKSDRQYIEKRFSEIKTPEDVHALWKRLAEVDPESAEKIHENNVKRVLRALEIYEKTGKPKSAFDAESKAVLPDVKIGMITLDFHDRELLYERTDARVGAMLEEGLLDEVRELSERGLFKTDSTAAQAIGYKELGEYLDGKLTLSEAVENLKTATRRYAKRQLTWFRHEEGAYRLFLDDGRGNLRPKEDLLQEAIFAARGFLKEFN